MTTTTMTLLNRKIEWNRLFFLFTGILLFAIVHFSPAWPDAIDPSGKHFVLSPQAKGALAIFLMASTWWVFEVIPIGITSLAIGVLQVLFLVRSAESAFKDFMTPSVLFIFASLMIGTVFTKTGLTRRLAYRMLSIVGEKTSRIYLGCFVVTAALSHIMAHTAVAATMYPLLVIIYGMYADDDRPTNFGKGLFIGMAFIAGAGSIVTLLGSARAAVAIGFYKDIIGTEISFFGLSYYMFPIGWIMVFIMWGFFMIFLKPEKKSIPGLKDKVKKLSVEMGGLTKNEIMAAVIVFACILIMSLRSFVPFLKPIDKTAIILTSTVLFFVLRILDIEDLESIPWNILLLFGGAMSIGFCLWETGAAEWLAIKWLSLFLEAHWFVFVMGIAFFVMIMTNFIMNVAAIAISLPVALVIAPYLRVAPEVILFASLVTAGMPFILLVGAAPNAIAYDSGQFTTGEFLKFGIPASVILMLVVGFSVLVLWPIMGMPILISGV
jgi:solute carrier family 13 (sodium-dependent dicarboxylate transporter), member 2/3/5